MLKKIFKNKTRNKSIAIICLSLILTFFMLGIPQHIKGAAPENVADKSSAYNLAPINIPSVSNNYTQLQDDINTGMVTHPAKYGSALTINSIDISANAAVFNGNTVTINATPSGQDIQSSIINALSNATAYYSVSAKYSSLVTWQEENESAPRKSNYESWFDLNESDFLSGWNVYKSGTQYVAEITLTTSNILSKYSLFDKCVFAENGQSSLTKRYNVEFSGGAIPTGVTVPNYTIKLKEGEQVNLNAKVTPSNAFSTALTYSSTNPSVASVDSNGYVTANGAGEARIDIYEPISGTTCYVTVTVEKNEVLPKSVYISKTSIKMNVNDSFQLSATINPENATDKSLYWTSSNPSVATVNNGNVYAASAGTADITVTTSNGKSATCTVTVIGYPTEITITGNRTVTIKTDDTANLYYDVQPSNAANYSVSWSSSNTSIVKVSSNGTITGVKAGTATITVKVKENTNVYDTITVVVKEKVVEPTKVELSKTSLTMTEGDVTALSATVSPANATDKTVTWSSDNTSVVSVSNGSVTAKKAGTANITVKTANGKTATCKITVNAKEIAVTGITINNSTLNLKKGNTAALTATVSPSNATKKNITWSTSNSAVATVSNGTVTAVGAGTATITAKTENGKTVTCKVTVTEDVVPTSVSLDKTTASVKKGETVTLTATVTPTNAVNKTVTWSSSNTSVATVNNGIVTAVKGGTATITAKTSNGKTASCTITVTEDILPESVRVTRTDISVEEGKSTSVSYVVAPTDATDKSATWSSSNESVATVRNGIIRGIKAGTATITVKTVNGKTDSCKVTVTPMRVSIAMSSTITTYVGDTVDFTPLTSITPDDKVTVNDLTWSSNKTNIGTVSGPKFTAKAVGMTVVSAKYGDFSSSCTVIVKSAEDKVADNVTSISITPSSVTDSVGVSKQLTLNITPNTIKASALNINWTSSDLTTVYVTANGQITLKKPGTATITATLSNGIKASCNVTVKEEEKQNTTPTGKVVYIESGKTIYMEIGDTITLNYKPEDPETKFSIITGTMSTGTKINEDGSITAVNAGRTSIYVDTATTRLAHCNIIVKLNEFQIEEKRLEFANEVLRLCNEERAKEGLQPLQLMDELNFAAQIRTDEQTEMGDISHTRPDGTRWTSVFQNISVKKRSWAENLILNYGTPGSVVRGWMNSPGHRANIMNPEFTHMGLGVSFGDYEYEESYICTQILIRIAE